MSNGGKKIERYIGSDGKEFACNAEDPGLIPGLRGSPGEGKGYPLQYSGLENSIDCIIHGVTKSWTRLSDFHFHLVTRNVDIPVCPGQSWFRPNVI